MKWKRITGFSIITILLASSACNLQFSAPLQGNAVDTAVSQTFDAQTQIARGAQQTVAAMVTDTLESPSVTPLPTFTFTPDVPRVSVSVETNCRWGPGQVYDYLGGLMVGETSEIFARDPTGKYWYIRNLDAPGFCWLWGEYATITGNTSSLPVYTPEPTPTPSPTPPPTSTSTTPPLAAFTLSYDSMSHCGASYLLKFKISNTGGVTWESISIAANDLTLDTSVPVTRDGFPSGSGCVYSDDPDLTPGEVVVTASGNLPSNPTGHSFMAFVRVYSQDGLLGTSKDKTIYFTP
jgi:hypothetical protein